MDLAKTVQKSDAKKNLAQNNCNINFVSERVSLPCTQNVFDGATSHVLSHDEELSTLDEGLEKFGDVRVTTAVHHELNLLRNSNQCRVLIIMKKLSF